MATLKILLLVILFIIYCNEGAEVPPCKPTVRDEPFTEFMESRNCQVDKDLLELFTKQSFKNSILDKEYANVMCIGLMDALTLVSENICDEFDPLSNIPDGDFCSSSEIAYLQKIVNGIVFDNKSNTFIVSNFIKENCKVLCKDDISQWCWAFGIIAKAGFKHATSTNAPTTVATTTAAPQPSTPPVLPPLVSQGDDAPTNGDVIDGDDVHTDHNKPGDHDNTSTITTNTTGNNVAHYFDHSSDNSNSNKSDTDSNGDQSTGTDGEGPTDVGEAPTNVGEGPTDVGEAPTNVGEGPTDVGEGPTDVGEAPTDVGEAPTNVGEGPTDVGEGPTNVGEGPTNVDEGPTDSGNNDTGDNLTHPIGEVGGDGNQIGNSTEGQSHPDATEPGSDATVTEQSTDQGDVDFDGTIGDDDDDDDGYSYWHFAAILVFILFLGVAGYLASLNRKKIRESVSTYMSKRKRKREYKPVNTMEAGLS